LGNRQPRQIDRRGWLFGLALVTISAPALAQPAPPDRGAPAEQRRSLVIGRVSDDAQRLIPRFRVLANHLAAALAEHGVTGAEVAAPRTNAEMLPLLQQGRVDAVFDTAYSALQYREHAGARIVLREWRDGRSSYRSILFVRDDSPIRTLDDLRGRVVAFEDPGSTSAYAVPAQILRNHGHALAPVAEGARGGPANATGYVFARTEINITTWVHRGMVDVGALSDADWDNPRRMPVSMRNDLRIIHRSGPLVRGVVLVRAGLDPAIAGALVDLLVGLHDTDSGREVLRGALGGARFDRITPEVQIELDRTAALLANWPPVARAPGG
jgi:phosphonate transport system substrate-binding protein